MTVFVGGYLSPVFGHNNNPSNHPILHASQLSYGSYITRAFNEDEGYFSSTPQHERATTIDRKNPEPSTMELEDGSRGTVYRLNYTEANVGKIVASSKVRVTWRFVSHVGHREHVVTLTWSKSTGKQSICMDGTEVWFGRNEGRSVFDHNWTTPDGSLKIHVLATSAPKMNSGFRSYDLLINGQLFASLPYCDLDSGSASEPFVLRPHVPIEYPQGYSQHSSILQILYPDGYIPPVDNNRQQQDEVEQQSEQQHSLVVANQVDSSTGPPNTIATPHQPMVDLLS